MGIFSQDYESSGVGISKNAPKKKGLKLYFELLFRKFWLITGVNLLHFIAFVPLVLAFVAISFLKNESAVLTIVILCIIASAVLTGPATAGLTKVTRLFILEKHSFIVRDFFNAFRNNFPKATAIGLIDCLVALSAWASMNVYPIMAVQYSKFFYVPMVITLSFALIVFMMNFYIYLMLIATDLSLKNLIKNSFSLAFLAMKKNLISILIFALTIVLMLIISIYATPLFMLLIPFFPTAWLWFTVCFNSYPVIQQYVINPYYESIGEINPELISDDDGDEAIFEDMGGKEKPVEKRKKTKGRKIT